MSDLRSQLIEAVHAALFVDGWEMAMAMDEYGACGAALDAMLDKLTELETEVQAAIRPGANIADIRRLIAVLRPVVEEPK